METQVEVSKEKLEAMLRKVAGLMAKADHPNTSATEANIFRGKAEALMYQYRITEAMYQQAQPAGAEIKPQWATWNVCYGNSEFVYQYRRICESVLEHIGIRGVYKRAMRPVYDEDGNPTEQAEMVICEAVGYESDLRIAESLYLSCMVAFQKRLEPKFDPALSQQENAYNMRSAGMEGWRIALLIFGKDDKALRPKVRGMFKAEAIKRGEDPTVLLGKGNSVKAFREDFALGFLAQIRNRMMNMRAARAEEEKGALVMRSRLEAINETFYAVYPQFRPAETVHTGQVVNVDPRQGCARCPKTKSGYCRDHAFLKPRTYRVKYRETNYTALQRGQQAARDVDLGAAPKGRKVEGTGPRGEL